MQTSTKGAASSSNCSQRRRPVQPTCAPRRRFVLEDDDASDSEGEYEDYEDFEEAEIVRPCARQTVAMPSSFEPCLAKVDTSQEVTEDDERDFERFMLPSTAPSRSLASIIMQKIQEKEAETDELTTEKVHGIVLLRNSTKNTYALCFHM